MTSDNAIDINLEWLNAPLEVVWKRDNNGPIYGMLIKRKPGDLPINFEKDPLPIRGKIENGQFVNIPYWIEKTP